MCGLFFFFSKTLPQHLLHKAMWDNSSRTYTHKKQHEFHVSTESKLKINKTGLLVSYSLL